MDNPQLTEHTPEEQSRLDSELRLQLALDATGDGLWDWNLRTGQVYLSPGYYAMTGYRPADEPGSLEFFRRLVHPDDWPHVMATMEAHLRGDTPVSEIEYRMLTASGEIRWTRGRGRVVERDAAGAPLRMLGLIGDITEAKRLQLEQETMFGSYQAIVASNIAGIAIVRERRIVWANSAMQRMFGYAEGELIGQPTRRVFPDDASYEEFGAVAYGTLRDTGHYFGTQLQQRKDGSLGWFDFSICLLPGSPDATVATIVDVSERKAAELSLADSEARYRAVVEDQTELIVRIAADGTILFANEVYCRFFGKSPSEVVGRKWQPVAHPDDLTMIETQLAKLSAKRPVVVIENRVFAGDRSVHWMQFVNRGLFDSAGCMSEIQVVGRDVTERRELEEGQRRLLDENLRLGEELIRIQERERAALAKELHDELSQQLVAIRAFAGAIARRTENPADKTRLDAQAIGAAASDIYAISHRLMEGLYPQALDSAGLVAAIEGLAARWSQAQPDVRIRLRTAGVARCAAETRINMFRIVQECLVNTFRHGHARRIRIFIGERQDGKGRRLRVVVRDDGVGMNPDAPRTGFGLTIVRERVRSLGGTLGLRLQPGRGVRVAVDVPLPD